MTTQAAHPNKIKMTAAIAGWIVEASAKPDTAALLNRKADWVQGQIALMCTPNEPAHLDGLTVWDMEQGAYALREAARLATVEKASLFLRAA